MGNAEFDELRVGNNAGSQLAFLFLFVDLVIYVFVIVMGNFFFSGKMM